MNDITVEFYDAKKTLPSPGEPQWCVVKYFDGINHEPFFTKGLYTEKGWVFMADTSPIPKKITHWAFLF